MLTKFVYCRFGGIDLCVALAQTVEYWQQLEILSNDLGVQDILLTIRVLALRVNLSLH